MKQIISVCALLLCIGQAYSQDYPEPEFSNEVYFLEKGSSNKLIRLEKATSEMNTEQGTFSGAESSYSIEGGKSTVRITGGKDLSFIISKGTSRSSSPGMPSNSDSIMRANGVDPVMMQQFASMGDPAQAMTLYKCDVKNNERKIILQKTPGINPFGKHKMISSEKYTFSARKIRDGYWEFVIDKPLPRGEYAFTMMQGGMSGMGSVLIFAFGIQ